MTQVVTSVREWRHLRNSFSSKHTIGFVPTMGNLHRGHQTLMEQSLKQNDLTVLSIFVNPTQFNDPNDLKKYPRTFDNDLNMAKSLGVDFVFYPDHNDLYPDNYRYQVSEHECSLVLEGMSRPGHFTGMLTIVLKLLNLVKPSRAYFGEKDFQQLRLVKDMVDAFFLDIEIIACPIIREDSGLAMSSRNNLLTIMERKQADQFAKGMRSCTTKEQLVAYLQERQISIDYIEEWQNRLLAAVQIGKIRLIDNKELA